MPLCIGSNTLSHGIRVTVVPNFLPAESDPAVRRFVFAYHITITNEGKRTAQLRSRHWIIVDAHGVRRDVEGPGVVGELPVLAPGESHQYSSFCPLDTEWGTMEGTFHFECDGNEAFDAEIGRFFLVAPAVPSPKPRQRVS